MSMEGSSMTDSRNEGLSLSEYAAHCRQVCNRDAQGWPGVRRCGQPHAHKVDGETVFGFCGQHWGPVLDAGEPA